MAVSVGFQNPSFTNGLKLTELRLTVDEKSGKSHFKRGNTRFVAPKGRGEDVVTLWLDPGKLKFEIEALPS